MQQAHLFISGTVQGVGFRQFVKQNARKLGLTGWVRNTEDGGVEAVVQDPNNSSPAKETAIIEELITLCKQGPFLAEVKHIGFEWEQEKQTYSDFTIQ